MFSLPKGMLFCFQRGTTLIELMVGITIMAILMAIGMPAFGTWMQNTHIRSAAESIQTGLQLARTEAVHRNTNVSFVINGTTSGWTVSCDVLASCSDLTNAPTIQTKPPEEGSTRAVIATSETGPNAASAVFAGTVTFNGLGQINATSLNVGDEANFDVSNPAGGACKTLTGTEPMRCLRIRVSTNGEVRMCDPAVPFNANTAPQGC